MEWQNFSRASPIYLPRLELKQSFSCNSLNETGGVPLSHVIAQRRHTQGREASFSQGRSLCPSPCLGSFPVSPSAAADYPWVTNQGSALRDLFSLRKFSVRECLPPLLIFTHKETMGILTKA